MLSVSDVCLMKILLFTVFHKDKSMIYGQYRPIEGIHFQNIIVYFYFLLLNCNSKIRVYTGHKMSQHIYCASHTLTQLLLTLPRLYKAL